MLDAGCGRGTFVAYARDQDMYAFGFDFSQWAVGPGRYERCKPEWLQLHDATKTWPYRDKSFDLVVCLDTLEHIYLDDLPNVIDEMYRVAKKWIFLQIATVDGFRETGYMLKKGEEIPLRLHGYAVAGHVTLMTESWWYGMLQSDDWWPRRDMVNWFVGEVPRAVIKNWLQNAIIVLERIE